MLVIKPYNRELALEYATRWALGRNPLFFDFKGLGGDCTNFVSQCVYAGSCEMNYTPTFGWYYRSPEERSAAWTGVEFFYNFFTSNIGVGPFAVSVGEGDLLPGDVIQLADSEGNFYHTLLVTGTQGSTYLVSAHTNDVLDRRLDTYDYATARYLSIVGVRYEAEVNYDCFYRIIGGISDSENRERGGYGDKPNIGIDSETDGNIPPDTGDNSSE